MILWHSTSNTVNFEQLDEDTGNLPEKLLKAGVEELQTWRRAQVETIEKLKGSIEALQLSLRHLEQRHDKTENSAAALQQRIHVLCGALMVLGRRFGFVAK